MYLLSKNPNKHKLFSKQVLIILKLLYHPELHFHSDQNYCSTSRNRWNFGSDPGCRCSQRPSLTCIMEVFSLTGLHDELFYLKYSGLILTWQWSPFCPKSYLSSPRISHLSTLMVCSNESKKEAAASSFLRSYTHYLLGLLKNYLYWI